MATTSRPLWTTMMSHFLVGRKKAGDFELFVGENVRVGHAVLDQNGLEELDEAVHVLAAGLAAPGALV